MGIEWWYSVCVPLLYRIVRIVGTTSTLVLVLSIGLVDHSLHILLDPGSPTFFSTNHFFGRIDDFVLGMILASAISQGLRFRRIHFLGFIPCIIVLWCFTTLDYGNAFPGIVHALQYTFASITIALGLLAVLAYAGPCDSILSFPLRLIGRMGFSVYVWHGPVLSWVRPDTVLGLFTYSVVLLSLSFCTYRFIEHRRSDFPTLVPAVRKN